jgi:D-sedoheptulose 7-phosphate isomerase
MHKLDEIFQAGANPAAYTSAYCKHLSDLLANLDTKAMARIIEAFDDASRRDRAIFFAANGGSAAMASHWVNDLVVGSYVENQPTFRAYCLSDNVASITAIGNDQCFEEIFVQQLRVDLKPGDIVFAMSVSGNSENVLRAVDFAHANGAKTMGICGMDGGQLKERCDIALHISTTADEYGPVEDIFSVVDHIVISYLAMLRGKKLHH